MKEQETSGFLTGLLRVRSPFDGTLSKQVNKFVLAGDKFLPERQLKQPGFTYSACGPFTKKKEKLKNLTKQ